MRKHLFGNYEIDSNGFIYHKLHETIIKGRSTDKNPYLRVNLWNNGKKKTYNLSKLMMTSFVSNYDEKLHVIGYQNGNYKDCSLDNLFLSNRNGARMIRQSVDPVIAAVK